MPFYSDIPEIVHFFHEQIYTSENIALKESILAQAQEETTRIKVFDRGFAARKVYDEFTGNNIQFISKLIIMQNILAYPIQQNSSHCKQKHQPLLTTDGGYLYSSNKQRTKYSLRRIEAIQHVTGRPTIFITNIKYLDAITVTEIYKKAVDIEVFFKFIKQLLNFKNLLNRRGNGIQVIVYVTMIAAILLTAYKKINNLKGFKIAKQNLNRNLKQS